MSRYLVQVRLVKLPAPDAAPDRWSSAFSTMTVAEVSVPFDSDDEPKLPTSEPYLAAVTRAIGRLSLMSAMTMREAFGLPPLDENGAW